MSITVLDKMNASKYVKNWITYDMIELLHKKYPHIISHLTYDIRRATKKDFYFPDELSKSPHYPIVVTSRVGKTLCELISCNPQTNSGPCTQTSKPQSYPVGDDGKKDVSCQASCFNLFPKNEQTGHQIQLTTTYHKDQCILIDGSIKAFMEFPNTRAAKPETRITDIPCGFNRSDHEHPYSYSGIRYHYNKTYCDSFFDEFDEDKKVCYVHWSKKYIGNVILGEYIIKACQALDRYVWTGSTLPGNNMKFNDVEADSKYLLKNWLENIDSGFETPQKKLDNLPAEIPQYPDNIQPEKSFIKGISRVMDNLHKPKPEISLDADKRQRLEEKAKTYSNNGSRPKRSSSDSIQNPEFIMGFITQLTHQEFWRDLALGLGYDGALYLVRSLLKKLAEKLTEKFATKLIGKKIFKMALEQGMSRVAKAIVIKIASKAAIALLKLTASALNVVGVLLNVLMAFELLLSLVDPLKLNNKYPDDFLDDHMFAAEQRIRQETGLVRPVVTFDFLANYLLSQKEFSVFQVNSIIYEAEYFLHLRVNSQGSVIDRGEKIDLEKIDLNIDDYDFINLRLYSQQDLYKYEVDHMKRIKVVDKIKKINYICTAALIISLVLQYFLLVILIIITICVLTYVQYTVLGVEDVTEFANFFL
ncbi:GSCOCT00010257001.2-RA-CDS [Cotesia congregata]|uniref:Cc_p74 n=1 Tax=Cotesia congregata TaxID=51543 RepID=B9W487_COTCN|nr:GSCOCT00010257001.2-RA-CDS [Cotesia congregata]CAG5075234.1 Cc_p74 [Cotesia congregata]CAR31575.1 putative per os infectivity factor p74 [Cotesia congregata]CAR82260.1 putative per os infectivity factor P74 [Cotesia congregata]